jgi:DNA-binding MarR family transcriptional regulator
VTEERSPAPPLARLFAIAYRSLIDDLHAELRTRGWDDVRPAFGFALLAAASGPTTITALAALTGTSKQAASKLVESMEAAGYLEREVIHGDARQRPVVLTKRGAELLRTVEEIYAHLEGRWAAQIGSASVERLRADLTTLLSDDSGTLPPVRPTL